MKPTKRPVRAWINQPSTLQPLHNLSGTNVLAVHERGDVWTVYFLHGPTISMECLGLWLSPGWISRSRQPTKGE